MTQPRKRTVILISGRGSNMAALIEAAREKDFPAEIVGVVSDRADAPGLKAAESFGIPTRVVPRKDHPTAEAHEKALDAALARLKAEIVCLAGYMRVLTPASSIAGRAGWSTSTRPCCRPSPGSTHIAARLDAGLRIHGCSVHFVTHEVDTGPLIAQAAVPVLVGDRPEQLSQRVLKAEHKLYPLALALLAAGKVRLEGGRAVFADIDQSARTGTLISPASWQGPSDLEDLARITP